MNKTKLTALLTLLVSSVIDICGSSEGSAPKKASKNYWRISLDVPVSRFKDASDLLGAERYGIGASFGLTIPIMDGGFWIEPMIGASYLSKFDKNKYTPTDLLTEIRITPMIDVGYQMYVIAPFVGLQTTAHILTDNRPDQYSENMFDISFRFGVKFFEIFKLAGTYAFLSDKSVYSGWGAFVGIGVPF